MNKGLSTKLIAINAMIAGVYAAFTLVLSPIAYLGVQFRLSEIMVFLAFYNKKFIPGLVIGCFIANIPSPIGILDIFFGTLSSLIVCIAIYHIKNKIVAAFIGALITGIIIGLLLHIAYGIPYIINAFYVFVGQFIVLIIGAITFRLVENNQQLYLYIKE